jgi:ParB-like chromosome segregation protein Spo0J
MVNPSDMVLKDVPLDLCEPDERFMYRTAYDDVSDLAESIASLGQLEPAVGWEDSATGRCYVIAGIRRLMATRMAKEKYGRPTTFRVLLVPAGTPTSELWRISLEENLRRRNLTDIEVVRIVRQMVTNGIVDMATLDRLLGSYDTKTRSHLLKLISNITDEELEDFALAEKWARTSGVLLGKQYLQAYHMVRLLGQERYYRIAGAYFALVNDWRPDDDPLEHIHYMRSAKLVVTLAPIELKMYEIGVQPPEGGWITPSLRQTESKKKRDESESVLSRAGPAREVSEDALRRANPPAPTSERRASEAMEALERAAPPKSIAPEARARRAVAGPVESERAPEQKLPEPSESSPPREGAEGRFSPREGLAGEVTEVARVAEQPVEEALGTEETRTFKVLLGADVDEFDVTCPYCGRHYHIEIVRRGSA